MADAGLVTARQRAILTAIVESYIETGEPVGSGTVARLQVSEISGLSPATVRNEMVELAEAGLLEQPHTSAGRVPTAQAFRMYVEQLGRRWLRSPPAPRRSDTQSNWMPFGRKKPVRSSTM